MLCSTTTTVCGLLTSISRLPSPPTGISRQLHTSTVLMVVLESVCAAAFSAGSAACLLKLLSPTHEQSSGDDNNPFVATLFVTCLMGAFALWTVKGPHACWHPSSGSPWSSAWTVDGDGSSATVRGHCTTTTTTVPKGEIEMKLLKMAPK